MNALILGGAGFLGANLVRRCLAEKAAVTVVDSLDPHLHPTMEHLEPLLSRIRFIRGDIRDASLLGQVVQEQDVIFHCAAQGSHPLSLQHPILDVEINCVGTIQLLEAMRLLNKKALMVFTSTSTVIGKAERDVVDETHPEDPLEIYSANKGVAERYCRIYNRVHGLRTVVLRFTNLYGPYGKGYPEFGFINYFINLAWNRQEITIFGEGEQTRNVLFVDDAVDALWRATEHPSLVGGTWFVTGDEHPSVAEIAEQIVQVFERGRVTHVPWPEELKRIEIGGVRIVSDRFRAESGWNPRHNFAEGLKRTRAVLEGKE